MLPSGSLKCAMWQTPLSIVSAAKATPRPSSSDRAAGHEPVAAGEDADLLVVDLTDDPDARIEQAAAAQVPRLAFYSHVEQDVRRRAEAAGIERVVPRSRMAREAAALVDSML